MDAIQNIQASLTILGKIYEGWMQTGLKKKKKFKKVKRLHTQ